MRAAQNSFDLAPCLTYLLGKGEDPRVFAYNQGLCADSQADKRVSDSMKTVLPLPDMEDEPPIRQWSAEEARRLREENPQVSPWRVLGWQVGVGFVVALAAWVLTGKQNVGWSAGYGALAVVVPAAVFARGLTRRQAAPANATSMVARFFLWELVKIGMMFALLAVAPKVVPALSWPALLVGVVLTMKVYWVALALGTRNVKRRVG